MKIIVTVLLALTLAVGMSTLASAQSSSVEGYNDRAGQVQSQVQGSGTGDAVAADPGGSLPFTGLDLALLALAGCALVAMGVGMRRLTKAPEST